MARKRWRRLIVGVMLSVRVLCAACMAGATEVSVEITDTGRQQIKLAIPTFVSQSGASNEMDAELPSVLRNDLHFSGFFDTMDNQAGDIEGIHSTDLKTGELQFKQWTNLGARLLIQGSYELSGSAMKIECRLYDTLGGDFILGKRYETDAAHVRDVMHRFADEVILKITGERGISSSKIVFVSDRSGSTELYQVDFDGENLMQLTHDKSLIVSPAVSPDGRKITYTSYKDNNPDLYLLSLDTQTTECISRFPGLNFSAAWSPDGAMLAVILSKDGNPELYVLDPQTKEERRMTTTKWNEVSPSWSPDGSKIVYTADQIGAPQLYVVGGSGDNPRRLTFHGSYNVSPDWSPTGDFITFSSSMDGNFNIYSVQTNGDNLRQLTADAGNNEDPAWSPDGRYLAFQSTRKGRNGIYIMNADGSNVRKLTDGKGTELSPVWMR